jgi:hypothetical protein
MRVFADVFADSYGKISWERELSHLDNFAVTLYRDKDFIGYIGYYVGKGDKPVIIRKRISRARDYLIRVRHLNRTRIRIIYLGQDDETLTMLQAVSKTKPPPF